MLSATKHTECVFASSLRPSGASELDGWGCGNCGSGILTPRGMGKGDMWAEAQSSFFTECVCLLALRPELCRCALRCPALQVSFVRLGTPQCSLLS
jgi:hypothetical protein